MESVMSAPKTENAGKKTAPNMPDIFPRFPAEINQNDREGDRHQRASADSLNDAVNNELIHCLGDPA